MAALTNFVDLQTNVKASWLNQVDEMVNTALGGTPTTAAVQTVLGIPTTGAPLPVNKGGTGAGTAAAGLANLGGTALSAVNQAYIGGQLWPQTPAEITASVTPVNYFYPELHVHRYGAIGDGVTNDYAAWAAALLVAGTGKAKEGEITCEQLPYLISTLAAPTTLAVPIYTTINGKNSNQTHSGVGTGATLVSAGNAVIMTFATAAVQSGLRNINIVGSVTAGGSQDGVVIGTVSVASRVCFENVSIFNCGNNGLVGTNINALSSFTNVYTQGCALGGFVLTKSGANTWINCYAQGNTSNGWDITSGGGSTAGGADKFYGCGAGENAEGLVFESGAQGHTFYDFHSEGNTTYGVWFKSGSKFNSVRCETVGSSGEGILNSGTQNHVFGNNSALAILYDPKPIQRVNSSLVAAVTGSTLTATPYSNSLPVTSQGKQGTTVSISPFMIGNRFVVRATGFAEIATSGVMTVFLTQSGVCIKAIGIQAIGGDPYNFSLEYEGTFSGIGANVFALYVSSSTASDSVTIGGHAGANIYGGAEVCSLQVEEWMASS